MERRDKKVHYCPHQKEAYNNKEIKAVHECLKDGSFLAGFGPKTEEFEEKISNIFGKKHGIFVNSGSSANLLALACLKLPEGSEVITPACTFSTTVAPIIQLGLKPVFCDVILNRYVPSLKQVTEQITELTKVIMIPNLIGNKPDWFAIKTYLTEIGRDDIILIEDSCDTLTNTPETDIVTTSFYASHIITAAGGGGMVCVNSDKLKNKILQFRDWGRIGDNSENMDDRFNTLVDGIPYDHKFLYGELGYNFKSCEMNAAFGLVQLEKFDNFREIRRKNFDRYVKNLGNIKEIILPQELDGNVNWLAIPLQLNPEFTNKTRVDLLNFLEDKNIQTRVLFSGNITRHPVYRKYFKEYKNSDQIMEFGFLLGAHHSMKMKDVNYVTNCIKEFLGYEEK